MSGNIWDTSVSDLLLRPSTSTEVTVSPPSLSAKTDISTAQQALGRSLPVVIGTGRVDGIYFVGGTETVSTVTTTDEEVPIPLQDTFVVVGGLPNAAEDLLNQAAFFAPRQTTSTSTTETENRTMAGYVLAYDPFERGYDLVRLEVDGTPVYDIEAGIPATTTFRFYGGRHSSTDEILTEIIGANAGAYQNFVMLFLDGYPADSPPLVSAVISNAPGLPPPACDLFIDFINHSAFANGEVIPWASLATIFAGGTVDAGGWYGAAFDITGGVFSDSVLHHFTDPGGRTFVIEYSIPVPVGPPDFYQVMFQMAGSNNFTALPVYLSVEAGPGGFRFGDDNGPALQQVGENVGGISRFAVSGNGTNYYGSHNGSAVGTGIFGTPSSFLPANVLSQVYFESDGVAGGRLRSFCVRPFVEPGDLPALSEVG